MRVYEAQVEPARLTASRAFRSLESCWSFSLELLHFAAVRLIHATLLLLGCLAVTASMPAAAQNYYDVEIVVFELLGSNASPDTPPSAATAELLPAPATAAAPEQKSDSRFEPLPPDRLQLNTEFQRLRNSKAYRPLLHARMAPAGAGSAHVGGAADHGADALGELQRQPQGVHGDLPPHQSRPHLRRAGEGGYRLRDNKRVRSRETHFFDHPRFGVLLRITPSPPPS
jgi:hypothetical protein